MLFGLHTMQSVWLQRTGAGLLSSCLHSELANCVGGDDGARK
jgi:hypothetical protein